MTKRVLIINNDGGPHGVRVRQSSGAVFDLANPGDSVAVYISGSQSVEVEEYDPLKAGGPATTADTAPEAPAVPKTPADLGLFQDKRLPGLWIYSTTQLMDKNHGLTEDQVRRIMLNCGCLENGVWWDENGDPFPAAFRGFEQADSQTEEARLYRRNATAFVKDIEQVTSRNGSKRWELSSTPLGKVLGLMGETTPLIYAVRARTEADLADWIRWAATPKGG